VKIRNANFEHFLWDDFDNRQFIADYYPWFLAIYHAYPREIYRADAVRYFFMYQFGGVYLDMDTECLEP
jgi:mannosyltransferase OCH1-like enzyme